MYIWVEELAKSLYAFLSLALRPSCHMVPTDPSSVPFSALFCDFGSSLSVSQTLLTKVAVV